MKAQGTCLSDDDKLNEHPDSRIASQLAASQALVANLTEGFLKTAGWEISWIGLLAAFLRRCFEVGGERSRID